MVKYCNCTPHDIKLNDGTTIQTSGLIARVESSYSEFDDKLIAQQIYGQVYNLPEPIDGCIIIVSAIVLSALAGSRPDVVAPATGHPNAIRNEKGHIVSVPGFVR